MTGKIFDTPLLTYIFFSDPPPAFCNYALGLWFKFPSPVLTYILNFPVIPQYTFKWNSPY